MNEPAMAEQEYPPKMADQVDGLLGELLQEHPLPVSDIETITKHIALLRLRVKKGENRKMAYANLNKSHLMALLELRWLRAMVRGGDPVNWAMVLEQAKGSLWAIFRKEQAKDKNSPQAQIDKLATFILKEIPGEPSRSEGAVDTAIRWMKAQNDAGQKLVEATPAAMLIDMGGASMDQIINGDAPIGLTDPGGESIFEGTWADMKSRLQGLSEDEKARGRNRGI